MAVSWPLARPCRGQGRRCRSARLLCRSAHPRAPARRAASRAGPRLPPAPSACRAPCARSRLHVHSRPLASTRGRPAPCARSCAQRLPVARAPAALCAPARAPACPSAHCLRASWPYCRPYLASCHNTTPLYCDTSSSPALQSIAIQFTVLRYSSPAALNPYVTIHLGFTIQPFPNLLQYNPSLQYNTSSPCNTVGQ